jgi:hypothetical protein
VAIDPNSEVIGAAEVSPAATGEAVVAPTLLDLVPDKAEPAARAVVNADSAYGTGTHLAWLDQQGFTPMVKAPAPHRTRRPVCQRLVPCRPPSWDGHLPGPGHGGDHPGTPGWWLGPVRYRVLSAYTFTCRSAYGLTCRSSRGGLQPLS